MGIAEVLLNYRVDSTGLTWCPRCYGKPIRTEYTAARGTLHEAVRWAVSHEKENHRS